jgi:hypothetical protein
MHFLIVATAVPQIGGWHAFRRDSATNLHHLQFPDTTIEAILRHSKVAVTQACYIKTISSAPFDAMHPLKRAANGQSRAIDRGSIPLLAEVPQLNGKAFSFQRVLGEVFTTRARILAMMAASDRGVARARTGAGWVVQCIVCAK